MRWGLVVLAVAFVVGCGPDEIVEVTGVVRDGRTGQALPGAAVRASGGGRVDADDEGRFTLTMPAGSDRVVRAVAPGRCPDETRFDVSTDGTPEVTVNLFPRLE
ncbi:MAG: hypothetical protein DRJ42_10945, partial [Deltaproteobacteria bacterium]